MMKKVVLDSSVLVSAFLTPNGAPAALLARVREGALSIHLSEEILSETARALRRPKIMERYGHTADEVADYLVLLAKVATFEEELPELRVVPLDPKDDAIVATAVKAKAEYLVTGDRKHLIVLGEHEGIRIVTPRQLLDLL